MRVRCVVMCLMSALMAVGVHSDIEESIKDGGSVVIEQEIFSPINEGSSLRRVWITLNDTDCPLQLSDAGVTVQDGSRSELFDVIGQLKPRVPISAYEVRFLLLDVFGDSLRILSTTEVKDFSTDIEISLSGRWRAADHEARGFLTAIAFVAKVRTKRGSVWQYDEDAIANAILSLGLTGFHLGTDEDGGDE